MSEAALRRKLDDAYRQINRLKVEARELRTQLIEVTLLLEQQGE